MRHKSSILSIFVLLCALGVLAVQLLSAQDSQCGTVDAIDYPVDPSTYQIVQTFGAPSPRHNGRFHTGEDWFGGADTLGQPVRAIARGRVTYSSPIVWGRDGGVVIIEHTMPDGSTIYSMYGHISERGDIEFPARLSCVQMGDIIGTIGEIRPAPHVHLEIRTAGPDIAGVGYEWEDPRTLNYRNPSEFITDWQAYLGTASLWHVEFADAPLAPPLVLNDYSLMTLNGVFLRRVLPDGRILWRNSLTKTAVAIVGYEGAPLLIYADGTMQRVDYEGNYGESWVVNAQFDSPPLETTSAHIFHTPDNALVAIDRRWRVVLWGLDDVPPFVRAAEHPERIALLTADYELLIVSDAGELLNRAQLREMPGLGVDESGTLVWTRLGLWRVRDDWTLNSDVMPPDTPSLAVYGAARFDGQTLTIGSDRSVVLAGITGTVRLRYETVGDATYWLLVSTGGSIILVSNETGALCGRMRVSGADDEALLWHDLGDDGVLRVMIGRRVLGIAWDEFNNC